ncbi:P-loop containing nucleoside triphosphate hydrolase protein [Tricharina praecox]|uniref:P-loop containing nucleoside triphosphate hydrolase protein n=1 Tax=Tricharina praecox TaxID=43433 RepID=UPI00221F32CC|nr:P-loop containing nucleoside triphosphate hydrolase protein [Tricharina praecox]KAI5844143.1 P-loop containing nucleoside triphosphate hydrolase protein [Tricharina praecox]
MAGWLRPGSGNPASQPPQQSGQQFTPYSSEKPTQRLFTVVKNAHTEIVRRNKAITEDRDFTARYALVDGKYVINVEPLSQAIYQHKGPFAQAGQSFPPQPERPFLGLGGFLRDYLGVQPYEEAAKKMIATGQPLRNYEHPYQISVEPYDPHQKDEYVISANIEIAWHSPAVAAKYADQPQLELDQDEMEEFFRQAYMDTVIGSGLAIPIKYKGFDLIAMVTSVQQYSLARKRPTEFAPRGLIFDETLINFHTKSGQNLRVRPSSTRISTNIIKQDFNFESMGIGGLDDEFAMIFRRAFASRIFPPGLIEKMGIQHVKGILLFGPPGTGKTLIARQIGKALNSREPKIVNGPEILNKFVGQSEENIRKLFADAEKEYKEKGDESGLHIIIFDELDAICKQRGSKNDGTGVGDTVVNQLLSKMDGVDQLNNVLIIGMTNRKDMIDEALLRPGRLEVHIEIALPDENGRRQILGIRTKELKINNVLDQDVDIFELASVTKNFSGAEIGGLVKSATSFAFNRHAKFGEKIDTKDIKNMKVNRADFMLALEEVRPAFGVSEEEFEACTTGGVIKFSRNIESILSEGHLFVEQVRKSEKTPLVSVLMHGPPGSGKTALAATIAMASDFPFIKIVSPEAMVGYNEMNKISHLTKVFSDAYKSSLNIVVVDQIERIIDWVPIGPRFSNAVLQTLVVLLRKPPPKGRRLLILATSTERSVLSQLDLLNNFDAEIAVPNVANHEELQSVLGSLELFSPQEQQIVLQLIEEHTRTKRINVGIKKILMAAETARQDTNDRVGRFVSIIGRAVSDMSSVY